MAGPHTLPLSDPAYWQDPYPVLAEAREAHPTAVTDEGVVAFLRVDECEELLTSGDFENEGLEYIERRGFAPGDPLYEWRRHSIGALNGAEHTRIRSLVGRAMTHRSVDHLRPRIRAHAHALIDGFVEAGRTNVAAGFARILPFQVIADFLGISAGELGEIGKQMSSGAADAFGPKVDDAIRRKANHTFAALMEFVSELAEARRREPQDDLLTQLIQVEEGGERLSRDELVVLFTNIFGGAVESTASVLTSAIMLLAQHPDQAARLRATPGLAKGTVEEVLRHRPAFYAIGKKAARDLDWRGQAFEAGQPITIPLGAPNRDPRRWADPDRFDITRPPEQRSLTFSAGSHFCLGQALARADLQEAVTAFVERCDEIELEIDPPRWVPFVSVNRVEALPVRFVPRPR